MSTDRNNRVPDRWPTSTSLHGFPERSLRKRIFLFKQLQGSSSHSEARIHRSSSVRHYHRRTFFGLGKSNKYNFTFCEYYKHLSSTMSHRSSSDTLPTFTVYQTSIVVLRHREYKCWQRHRRPRCPQRVHLGRRASRSGGYRPTTDCGFWGVPFVRLPLSTSRVRFYLHALWSLMFSLVTKKAISTQALDSHRNQEPREQALRSYWWGSHRDTSRAGCRSLWACGGRGSLWCRAVISKYFRSIKGDEGIV